MAQLVQLCLEIATLCCVHQKTFELALAAHGHPPVVATGAELSPMAELALEIGGNL